MAEIRVLGGTVGRKGEVFLDIEGLEYEQRVDEELVRALGLVDEEFRGDPDVPAIVPGELCFKPGP